MRSQGHDDLFKYKNLYQILFILIIVEKVSDWDTLKDCVEFITSRGVDPAERGCSTQTSAIEATKLSKR